MRCEHQQGHCQRRPDQYEEHSNAAENLHDRLLCGKAPPAFETVRRPAEKKLLPNTATMQVIVILIP